MKKIYKIFGFIFAFLICVCSFTGFSNISAQASDNSVFDFRSIIETYTVGFVGDESRENRFAGSEAEKNSANYICEALTTLGLEPVNDTSTVNGIQTFSIAYNLSNLKSQNVIFRKIGTSSEKKVIIGTHYDSDFGYALNDSGDGYEEVGGQGVVSSGAGVGTLLALASAIMTQTFDFDIEFVFFGAYNHSLAGSSYYSSFITKEQADNILLMINLDKMVGDGKLYMYTGEFKSNTDAYLTNTFSSNFNARDLSKYNILSDIGYPSITGLDYTNFALESDNANFIRLGIPTLSLMTISDKLVSDMNIVSYSPFLYPTEDNLETLESYEFDYLNNLSLTINGTLNLLSDDEFSSSMSGYNHSNIYILFGDNKMIVFITLIIFIVLCFVVYLVHMWIDKKAMREKQLMNFDKIISTISINDADDIDNIIDRIQERLEKEANQIDQKKKSEVKSKEDIEKSTEEKSNDQDKE